MTRFNSASGPSPAAIAASILFAACAALAQPPSEGAIDLAGASRVRISAFGRVTVEASGNVSDIRYAWTGAPAAIAFRTSGAWRQLSVARDPASPPPGELRITLPASLAATFVGSDQGSVTVRGLNGSLDVMTLAGNISVSAVNGPVSARTGGGEMSFSAIGGPLRSLSGGGSINVESAAAANLQTAGGDIIVGRVTGPLYAVTAGNIQVRDAASTVTANTAGGRIQIERARGLVTAENGGGSIVVGSAPGVQAESAGGGILLKSISGPVRASTASGPVVAIFARNATLATSFLSSGGGDVTAYLPSNTAVTVKAINETAGAGGGFVSDFPSLSLRQPASGFGPAFAQGSLNGGGPLLMLSVSRGSIFVRKAR